MPRQQRDTRKRTGCAKCKEQHIRCSEELPQCRRCQLLGLECARGLKLIFREDALQRGISFGREGVWSKKGGTAVPDRITETGFQEAPLTQYNGRWVFLNLNEHDFQDIHETRSVPRTCPSLHPHQRIIYPFTSLSIPTSIYHPLHSFPDTESYLLDYFIRDISPHCSLSELNNPYTSFVVPLGFVSVTLRHALLAVAANRLYLLGKDEYAEQVCYYKHMALRGLQQELSAGVHDDGTVASILMLCFQDISEACSSSWMIHLRAGLKLIDYSASHSSSGLWKFFRMYFVAHDIMSRTTSDSWPEDETLHLWYDDENLEEIDVLMGCSRSLMTLINKISIHASTKAQILRSRSLTRYEVQKYASISSEVGKSLLSLKQRFSEQSEGKKGLQRVAQIKHAAALLYLTERFGPKKGKCASTCFPTCFPASLTAMEWELEDIGLQRSADQENISRANHQTSGPQSDTSTANYHKPLGDITGQEYKGICAICKVKLITSMIELISTLPDMATLLWPLFVLGNVGLENEEQRRFVIDRLANIQRTQNLGSVRRTIDAVKHAFGTKELLPSNERSWGHETYHYISLA